MRKSKNHIYAIYWCFISLGSVYAQNAPQYSLTAIRTDKLSYDTRDLWNVIIQNASQKPTPVFLQAQIVDQQKGRTFEVRSADFLLQPGVTTFSRSNYSLLLPERILFQTSNFKDHLIKTSSYPNGEYEICIFLFDSNPAKPLAQDCYNITQLSTTPPYLIAPYDQDTVREEFPFFIWSPPAPQPTNNTKVSYALSVFEIYPQQTAISASQTNPEWLLAQDITSPIYQYGIDLRPFTPGRKYSWYVTAYVNGLETSQSEIWWFIYQPSLLGDEEKTSTKTNKRKPGTIYYRLSESPNANSYTLKKEELNFIFINQNAVNKLPYRITDALGNVLHYDHLSVVYGQNFISINLKEQEKIKKNDLLILEIKDVSSPPQFLSFKYSPAEK